MSFKVGDRVRVQSEEFADQNGLTGMVIEFGPERSLNLNVRIRYDSGQLSHPFMLGYDPGIEYTNVYRPIDLVLDDNYLMEDHGFTLDEILQSKELIEGLEHDRRRNR